MIYKLISLVREAISSFFSLFFSYKILPVSKSKAKAAFASTEKLLFSLVAAKDDVWPGNKRIRLRKIGIKIWIFFLISFFTPFYAFNSKNLTKKVKKCNKKRRNSLHSNDAFLRLKSVIFFFN